MAKILTYHSKRLQDPELKIALSPFVSEICSSIAAARGIDPLDLAFSYLRKGIAEDWNFQKNKPKEKQYVSL